MSENRLINEPCSTSNGTALFNGQIGANFKVNINTVDEYCLPKDFSWQHYGKLQKVKFLLVIIFILPLLLWSNCNSGNYDRGISEQNSQVDSINVDAPISIWAQVMAQLDKYIEEVDSLTPNPYDRTVYAISFVRVKQGNSFMQIQADRYLPEINNEDSSQLYELKGITEHNNSIVAIYDYVSEALNHEKIYTVTELKKDSAESFSLDPDQGIFDDFAPSWIYKLTSDSVIFIKAID